jgi:UDP-2,4-diacetamido-2,4,6-trideoxy-beta-L-altropyranose hydrolase
MTTARCWIGSRVYASYLWVCMANLNFVFRVDSSRDVGSGHVMRCLSLADCLAAVGNRCAFLCRRAPGDLINEIEQRGHSVIRMPSMAGLPAMSEANDARATGEELSDLAVDWLVVDHYGLGIEWERAVGPCAQNLLVIDDIGRDHECSLLLDQNFANPMHDRYRRSLSEAKLLIGPQYALLRADFAASRATALQRRTGMLVRILVSMGGSDPSNATAKALAGLESAWQEGWQVDVIIGASNPHRESIESISSRLPAATLHVQTSNMAQLMTAADCAIGAGGSTTWERCCLGLPSLVSILSNDQISIATAVAQAGAQSLVGRDQEVTIADYTREVSALSSARLLAMSAAAARICDGLGASRVAERLQ